MSEAFKPETLDAAFALLAVMADPELAGKRLNEIVAAVKAADEKLAEARNIRIGAQQKSSEIARIENGIRVATERNAKTEARLSTREQGLNRREQDVAEREQRLVTLEDRERKLSEDVDQHETERAAWLKEKASTQAELQQERAELETRLANLRAAVG